MGNMETLNGDRFPLTTQAGLNYDDQAMIDSINLDQLREMVTEGEPMSDRQKARFAELEEKHRMRVEQGRADGTTFTGDHQPAPDPEPIKQEPKTNPKPEPSEFALSDEEAERVERGHREMMSYPETKPIDHRAHP